MLETIEYVCETCSERVTLPEGEVTPCPVCQQDTLKEED